MLTHLRVRNLAIVEEFSLDPGPGLNVLTGETGAGKSLLIDSLEFIGGERGSTDSIRTGTDKMSAEASFEVMSEVSQDLDAIGVEAEPGQGTVLDLIVKRELSMSGRGRALMNGSLVSVRDLTRITGRILQIHGQSASQARIAGKNALELIDDFAGSESLLASLKELYSTWKKASQDFDSLTSAEKNRTARLEQLRYEIDEISAASLEAGEEESLRSERNLLTHSEEIIEATSKAFVLLDEGESSALSQISRAAHLLQPLQSRIPDLSEPFREIEEIRVRTQEVSRSLSSIAHRTRHDPARLDSIEERLAFLDRLKKKYGVSIAGILESVATLRIELDQLTEYASSLERLRRARDVSLESYRAVATELSEVRRKAGRQFESGIQQQLQDLAMARTVIALAFGTLPDSDSALQIDGKGVAFSTQGYDQVEILITPNPGETARPLHRIASGGELSRIQLAIAATLFHQTGDRGGMTLVFDEIDAGVGGRVADVVGKKLRELSETSQVLCVTHLPQIACFGTTHFVVKKEESQGRTRATITRIDTESDRVSELARMLGGETISDTAIDHATDLLARAGTIRRAGQERKRAG